MLKKILLIFMIIIILCSNYQLLATDEDYGIMPLASMDDSNFDADNNLIIDYTFHSTNQIYKDTVTIPYEGIRDGTYASWCLFISTTGTPYIFASTSDSYSSFYFIPKYDGISDTKVICSTSSQSGSFRGVYFSYVDGKWSSATNFGRLHSAYCYYGLGSFLPSSFLYSSNANVMWCTTSNSSDIITSSAFSSFSFNEIHSCYFVGKSPYLITLSDTTYKIGLGSCYEGYTYDGEDKGVSITQTTCNNLFIYIYDMDESSDVYKYYFSLSALTDYIYWDEEYGMVLELPFDTAFLPDFFVQGHHYSFAFSIACISTCKIPNSLYTYNYYDTASFSADLASYGSGASIDKDNMDDIKDALNKNNQAIIDASNKQIEAIEKQHETSKSIWETIKEILSYLNPFSENFFAYKLVELILDGIKSLFIPEDGFFGDFFDSLYSWFEEKLGILFYPFQLIIEILERIANINFSEPIFNVPDIQEPFTNKTIISATTYNLNDLLNNSIFSNIHNIYLICVDAFIAFGLVNLAKRKFEEVMRK